MIFPIIFNANSFLVEEALLYFIFRNVVLYIKLHSDSC